MILVHHLNNSRSQRVLWLLEELGLPYEIKRYERDPATLLGPPELKTVHPLGKSPVLDDGEVRVAETGAIIEYLLDAYDPEGRLRPARGTADGRRFTYWLHYAADIMMSFPLEAAASRAVDLSAYPNIARFLQTIHARPAWKRALERGGDYAYA